MAFKLKSTKLKDELKRRRSEFAGRVIAAKITLPPGNEWWYYHEFGTATHAEKGSEHPGGYEIDPVNGEALKLPATAEHPQETFLPHVGPPHTVYHPGVEAKHMVGRVFDEIVSNIVSVVSETTVGSAYSFQATHNAFISEGMQNAKQAITDSIAEQLPGTRDDGKLRGKSAADVFEAEAEIVDLT